MIPLQISIQMLSTIQLSTIQLTIIKYSHMANHKFLFQIHRMSLCIV